MKRFNLTELRVADSDDDSDELASQPKTPHANPGTMQAAVSAPHASQHKEKQSTASESEMPREPLADVVRVSVPNVQPSPSHPPLDPTGVTRSPAPVVVAVDGARISGTGSGEPVELGTTQTAGSSVAFQSRQSSVSSLFFACETSAPSVKPSGNAPPHHVDPGTLHSGRLGSDSQISSVDLHLSIPSLSATVVPSPATKTPPGGSRITGSRAPQGADKRTGGSSVGRDSDADSVEFEEITSDEGEMKEVSVSGSTRACAVVLDDGREATPDLYESEASLLGPIALDNRDSQRLAPVPFTARSTSRAVSGTHQQVSLYRQRLLERRQAEERRIQEEVERQWQELTFQPAVQRDAQHNTWVVDVVHAQPYYQRLYADAVSKRQRSKRSASNARTRQQQRTNVPKLSERTVELAGQRTENIFLKLYPDPPKPEPQQRKTRCGSKAVVERLLRAARKEECCTAPKPTFTPEITDQAKRLGHSDFVDRLYKPKKRIPPPQSTAADDR